VAALPAARHWHGGDRALLQPHLQLLRGGARDEPWCVLV